MAPTTMHSSSRAAAPLCVAVRHRLGPSPHIARARSVGCLGADHSRRRIVTAGVLHDAARRLAVVARRNLKRLCDEAEDTATRIASEPVLLAALIALCWVAWIECVALAVANLPLALL